jgi:menaquinone-specific isochorismate synthase
LRHAVGQARVYWESHRDGFALAGAGVALELMGWGQTRFESVQAQAQELFADAHLEAEAWATPRLFGGFAFRDDFVPDNTWADFTPAHFILPHYQLVQRGEQSTLTLNAHVPHDESLADVVPSLREALQARIAWLLSAPASEGVADNPVLAHDYPMRFEDWEQAILHATARMKRGELQKIVLSRVAELRFMHRVNVDSALDDLAQKYPQTYRFLFEPRPYHAFYGATPEMLADVRGRTLHTMGLAGSIRRGQTPQEDDALAEQLLNDPKERSEHGLVVEAIRARLTASAQAVRVAPTSVMKLPNIQHLYTPITADLRADEGVLAWVARLHPTPALGGEPRELALEAIGQYESVTRGWFGAPIGWLDASGGGQFSVAIRSAVAQDRRVWLYAGAGIVAESVARKEWDETALKFKPMLHAHNVQEGQA